jgi:hypothetical protein
VLAKVRDSFKRISAPKCQPLPTELLYLLQAASVIEPMGGGSLDKIDVFACLQFEMLAWQEIQPAKYCYVHLKDKSGERRMGIAVSIPA